MNARIPLLLLALSSASCDTEGLCPPCGSVADGQLTVSGDARLDGTFLAVADLQRRVDAVRDRFERDITALARIYGLWEENSVVDAELIDALTAAVVADLETNLVSSPMLAVRRGTCHTDPALAYSAQRRCESQRDCTGPATLGQDVPFACDGICTGACEGCEGPYRCTTPDEGMTCSGVCEGVCMLAGGQSCEGTCRGTCDGTCSQTAPDGSCVGQCDGTCEGTCEPNVPGTCEGTCVGACITDTEPSDCSGTLECAGACPGGCLGTCEGYVTGFEIAQTCADRAACSEQALVQTAASLQCTPPVAVFGPSLGPDAPADFVARLHALQRHGLGVLAQRHLAAAYVRGESGDVIAFDPAPLDLLETQLEARLAGRSPADVTLDIVPSRDVCLRPALRSALDIVTRSRERLEQTLELTVGFEQIFAAQ